MSNILRIILLSSEPGIILSVHKILQKHDVLFTFSIIHSLAEFIEKQNDLKGNIDFLLIDMKVVSERAGTIETLLPATCDRAHWYYVSLAPEMPEVNLLTDRTALYFSKTPDTENRTADTYDFIIDLLNMKRGT